MQRRQYDKCIKRITEYLKKLGYSVTLRSTEFCVMQEEKTIRCSWRSEGKYDMIVSLLHEAGHVVQPATTFVNLRKSTKRDRAIVVEQEYKAWELGWGIAEELNIASKDLQEQYIKSWLKYWTLYIETLYIHAHKQYISHLSSTHVRAKIKGSIEENQG